MDNDISISNTIEPDSFDSVLSKISGISEGVIREIAIKVMENNKILNSCGMHSFDVEVKTRNWKCSKCGGTVSFIAKRWYEKGLKHQMIKHIDHMLEKGELK